MTMSSPEPNVSGPPDEPADPVSGQRGSRIVLRESDDLAAMRGQIGFALQVMGFWGVGVFVAATAGSQLGSLPLGLAAFGLVSFVGLQFFLGGTARLVAARLQNEPRRGSGAAWAFIGNNWLGLILGSFLTTIGTLVAVLAVLATVHSLATKSSVVGSVAILPVWFFCLFGLALLANCQLLPVVMGVENVGVIGATSRILGINPLWRANHLLVVVQMAGPRILASVFPVGLALVLTFFATTGEWNFSRFQPNDIGGPVATISYLTIIAIWLGYSASVVATEYTIQYFNKSS